MRRKEENGEAGGGDVDLLRERALKCGANDGLLEVVMNGEWSSLVAMVAEVK